MYIGCLLLMSGYYYRKPLVYKSIYTYVLIENYINGLRNKYFRNNLNIYKYDSHSIIELFDTQFNFKKYILKPNSEITNTETNISFLRDGWGDAGGRSDRSSFLDVEFNTKHLFISILFNFNNTETDLTNEINLFVSKNTNIQLNRNLAIILNDFLSLGLDTELLKDKESIIQWKVIDHTVTSYEGAELNFNIDEDYLLHNSDKMGQSLNL